MAYIPKYVLLKIEKNCEDIKCEIKIVKKLDQVNHIYYITGTAMFDPGLISYHLITLEKGYFEPIHLHLLNKLTVNSY